MPEEPKPEVAIPTTRPFRSEEHVRWSNDVWRVVERQLFVTEPGKDGAPVEHLEARAIRVEARVGEGWQMRIDASTMGVQCLKQTIFSLVDLLAAEQKRHDDFKATLEAKESEAKKASEGGMP